MFKLLILVFLIIFPQFSYSDENVDFNIWLDGFKVRALKEGISKTTINKAFVNTRYLKKVIEYDRRQPEFYEDTQTYVSKRATLNRALKAQRLLNENKTLFNEVEKVFKVEKEILLALWGIETNFGKHVGKMDIISSLATLSFDKRRSEFFSKQLIVLLKLIDKKSVDVETLYGSWAGAFGNFQFMPTTINNYAIDFDKNKKIELKKSLADSLASAANYLRKIGWRKGQPCFYRVMPTKELDQELINYSARNISHGIYIDNWKKKGIVKYDETALEGRFKGSIILPDGKSDTPMFLVFDNYKKILKWNRSLRFAISVCTLSNLIKSNYEN